MKKEISHERQVGRERMHGYLDVLSLYIVYVTIIIVAFSWLYTILQPIDDTDQDRFNRSGVIIVTDYGTGAQYLYRRGAMIPRRDQFGNQMFVEVPGEDGK